MVIFEEKKKHPPLKQEQVLSFEARAGVILLSLLMKKFFKKVTANG